MVGNRTRSTSCTTGSALRLTDAGSCIDGGLGYHHGCVMRSKRFACQTARIRGSTLDRQQGESPWQSFTPAPTKQSGSAEPGSAAYERAGDLGPLAEKSAFEFPILILRHVHHDIRSTIYFAFRRSRYVAYDGPHGCPIATLRVLDSRGQQHVELGQCVERHGRIGMSLAEPKARRLGPEIHGPSACGFGPPTPATRRQTRPAATVNSAMVVALICDAQQAGHEGGSESCDIDGH